MPETRRAPALTAEEWADVLDATDANGAASGDIANLAFAGRFHGAAAVALVAQPFGFTREDVAALSRCADDAERLNASRMWDDEGHAAHERVRTIAERIKALLPP